MELRVKEVCKAKGVTMKDLASKVGMHPVNLSTALSRNPTLSTLQKIADALAVEPVELIERSEPLVCGCVRIGDKSYTINSKKDLTDVYDEIMKVDSQTDDIK